MATYTLDLNDINYSTQVLSYYLWGQETAPSASAHKYRVRPLFACKDEKVGYKREFYIMDFFLNPLKEV